MQTGSEIKSSVSRKEMSIYLSGHSKRYVREYLDFFCRSVTDTQRSDCCGRVTPCYLAALFRITKQFLPPGQGYHPH